MQGTIFTSLAALALTAPAFAQNSASPAQSNGTRTDQQNLPNRAASRQTNPQNKMSDSDFDKIDKKHRGYLIPRDVASDKKLAANFESCDKNQDGRLSREEYEACSAGR